MADNSESLIKSLIKKVREYPRFSKEEIEKFCWMAVHEHKHGVLPSEYDIREIDEDLWLKFQIFLVELAFLYQMDIQTERMEVKSLNQPF